jgi:hypothetical protein
MTVTRFLQNGLIMISLSALLNLGKTNIRNHFDQRVLNMILHQTDTELTNPSLLSKILILSKWIIEKAKPKLFFDCAHA